MGLAKNTDALYKKSHLYVLTHLRSFNICKTVLQMFYAVCQGSRLRVKDANRLIKLGLVS